MPLKHYTRDDVLTLAKRHHNVKRRYLLVDPLQAKHLPVSPGRALEMMAGLGERVAQHCPSARLVIGFAETATAIGAAVAEQLGEGCKYIHTTREPCGEAEKLCFSEEHSHAVEQTLVSDRLARWIDETPAIVFADDEISTGKTLLNIIEQLRRAFPQARTKPIIAASVIERLSPEHEARFRDAGVESVCLVKLENEDLTGAVERFDISAPEPIDPSGDASGDVLGLPEMLWDPRFGVDMAGYAKHLNATAAKLMGVVSSRIAEDSNVLVLGTEECMYPALIFAGALERSGRAASVRCHATTRSPIGICGEPGYPIRSGRRLRSFYDDGRETFIYDLDKYDSVIVITDTPGDDAHARADLAHALRAHGCRSILFVEGGRHV